MAAFSFLVVKVNGADITNIPLDEAVQRLLTATEPIALEVERKAINVENDVDTKVKSSSGNSEAKDNNAFAVSSNREMILTFKTTDLPGRAALTKNSSKCTQTDDNEYIYTTERQEITDRLIEQEHNIFEQCLAPDIDIEEITLRKSDSNERLGLTVYYNGCSNNSSGNNINSALSGSDDNEMCTEVFISDIQPDSIAGRDGRLRQGDQILQINGKDIKNKEETEALIAENNNAVTLLVSRYLYTDEDDFNDPAVIDLEVDEDDEEEFYDENNIGYENCFVTSDYINAVDDLDKAFLAQAMQQVTLSDAERCTTMTTTTVKSVPVNSADNNSESITTKSVNTKSKSVKIADQTATPYAKGDRNETQSTTKSQTKSNKQAATPNLDYETEHIYETIPEDFEAEPFYCSPYESSTYVTAGGSCSSAATDALQLQQQHQKQRVAQWLGMKQHNLSTTTPRQSSRDNINRCSRNSMRQRSLTASTHSSHVGAGVGCPAGVGNSSNTAAINHNDDHENSSSAYNTGGSNNSTTQPNLVQNQQHSRSDGATCSVDDEPFIATRGGKILRIQSPKDKVTSPKNSAVMGKCSGIAVHIPRGNAAPIYTSPHNAEVTQEMIVRLHGGLTSATMEAQLQQQQYSPKAVYTNESNIQQTMMSQQRLLRQAFAQQQQQQQQQQQECKSAESQLQPYAPCPHFTAPNLSQYHFVSSQQQVCANAVVLATKKNATEEAMVWKVKRRQDGTRYIVRRPARNRLLRNREIRLNTEHSRNNMTTTEDDTISEVKLGRYWSKEERRKHIERARERRQQQQRNLGTMMSESCMSTIPISNKTATKLQRHPAERSPVQQQQPASVCLLRQLLPTTKTLQQHQLHFNSDIMPHQYCPPPTSIACNAVADVHGSELTHVASTTAATTAAARTTATDATDIPYSAPSTGVIPHSTQMSASASASTAINSDKVNVLLSVTTV